MSLKIEINFFQYLLAFSRIIADTLFQRWRTRHLAKAGEVCHVDISEKTCIVTGATSGIGLQTARELAIKGAYVVLACRNISAAEKIIQEWKEEFSYIQTQIEELDLSSLSSVRQFCQKWNESGKPIHVLINNAGIFSMKGKQKFTCDGFEEHMGINFFAPSLLTILLLPSLSLAHSSRVINVNSKMHELGCLDWNDINFTSSRNEYTPTKAYCQSKLCQLLFTISLQRRFSKKLGIVFVALHPGEVLTNVVRTLPEWLIFLYKIICPLFLLTASQGARPSIFCASHPSILHHAKSGSNFALESSQIKSNSILYYSSDCSLSAVGVQARNVVAADELFSLALQRLNIDSSFIDSVLKSV